MHGAAKPSRLTSGRLWSFFTATRSADPDVARLEFLTKAILVITAYFLLFFTGVFLLLHFLGDVASSDLLVILGSDIIVIGCLFLSRGTSWRLIGWSLVIFFLALACLLTLQMGGSSPASVNFALAVALAITLLGDRTLYFVVPVCMVAYAAATFIHGVDSPGELLSLIVRVAAPITGIAVLMRFSSRQLEEALASSRTTAAGLESEIMERRTAEVALRESLEKIRAFFASTPDAVVVMDLQARILDANDIALRMFDMTERGDLVGKSALAFVSREDLPQAIAGIGRLKALGPRGKFLRIRMTTRTGRAFEAQISGAFLRDLTEAPTGIVAAVRDITEQLALEAQLRQSHKMQAVGQLAGGVAHDFNNLLLGIQGSTEIALRHLEDQAAVRENLKEALAATDRAATLVRQLLAFSRPETLRPQILDLNALIERVLKMLGRLIGEHVTVSVNPASDIRGIRADPGQIEQAVLNLCLNARDAMSEGGDIEIATRNVTLDAAFAESHQGAAVGEYVLLKISDTGTGFSAEAMQHLYEPFFTTKRPDHGTGLGLATVYGIVERHDGFIECASEPSRGTAFSLYFPATAPASPREAIANAPGADPIGGDETLLLAEDDDLVRELASRILSDAGYTIIAARDGVEALRLFGERGGDFGLALIDVVMPGVNGRAVAKEIRRAKPDMPILFSSGYDFQILDNALEQGDATGILLKPYHASELLLRVREAIDHPGRPGH